MKQEPLESRVSFMMFQSGQCESLEDGPIVLLRDGFGQNRLKIERISGARFMIQDGRIELILIGEMTEHHRLRDACMLRDFLRCCFSCTLLYNVVYCYMKVFKP